MEFANIKVGDIIEEYGTVRYVVTRKDDTRMYVLFRDGSSQQMTAQGFNKDAAVLIDSNKRVILSFEND